LVLTPEIEAQILRFYHAERWRIGTIATQLRLHRDTVTRVLSQAGLPLMGPVRRASAIDLYLPFIRETLAQFPMLALLSRRSSRLFVRSLHLTLTRPSGDHCRASLARRSIALQSIRRKPCGRQTTKPA